ncbi:glutathione S-transferase N-terminal domain-containing protein [Natronolimnohabitans sp. A-GB9]|uniref:glutathione S-transferase N-terminal domain-containing protein n=1 Tax=Natronolimnohabitans sp. A-GB9 TaxID=3069757 RepID=UPI0027B06605|nr:glutathione S-transferase N-terminal domain-containing protein [Natronolimnohabitans sp. A-GB9]MDQ2050548.1 glutathione S-transferase N-terminal domain-containing protein [Natronolimnohabitans sp. A-GB9]
MLELYQAEGCPNSTDVRETLTGLGVSYVIHNPRRPGAEGGDTLNERTQQAMLDLGSEDSIPFLVDTSRGETLHESEAIVEYLERHYQ